MNIASLLGLRLCPSARARASRHHNHTTSFPFHLPLCASYTSGAPVLAHIDLLEFPPRRGPWFSIHVTILAGAPYLEHVVCFIS